MFCILWRKEAAIDGGQLKVMFLNILQKLTGKQLSRSLYFNEVASSPGVLLWILRNIKKQLFKEHLRTTASVYNTNIIIPKWYK